MKNRLLTFIFLCIPGILWSQDLDVSKLFLDETPLDIKLRIEMKEVKGNQADSVYYTYMMHYKEKDNWDSIKIEVRARGNFRRKECYFPPLRVKIKKDDAKGTVFEGNKSLKLVMPCKSPVKDNSLIMKEYVCYQMYEPITKYTFNTRLVNIEFLDIGNKKAKPVQFRGFFIEDDDVVAKRHHGKVVEDMKIHPVLLQDSSSVRHDIFQYMVANTDWSTTFLHNAKVIQLKDTKKYIPLAYDFDMAGFVNAPYSSVSDQLGIASVRERLYRGFCRPEEIFQAIRKEYIAKESAIKGKMKESESDFDPKEFAAMMKYMDEFFNTLKNDKTFKAEIVSKCRNN
jgi:hypothetical protein